MIDTSDCGCCVGTATETPAAKSNAPGLPAIAYRVGTQPTFKASLLARLSSTEYPALSPLTTRSDDDWTIALCDAFACMADVLTFYQERIANESYLRTATERRSVLELAQLIGYQLAPGVAASTAFAFTLESAPGQPSLAAQPVTIPIGTRVQSVPDPEQDPQNFETVAAIIARVEWNAIPVKTAEPIVIAKGLNELYIVGTNNQIQPGDAILVVGSEQTGPPYAADRWNIRWLDQIEIDLPRGITRLAWSEALDGFGSSSNASDVKVCVFRQRAALFGNNAPDANLIVTEDNKALFEPYEPPNAEWKGIETTEQHIDLDATYPRIVQGSWFALAIQSVAPIVVALHRATAVSQLSRTGFGLSAKITRLQCDPADDLVGYNVRKRQVLAQSEELPIAPRPLPYPVYGSMLELGNRQPDLGPGQLLAVSGNRQRVKIEIGTGVPVLDDKGTATLRTAHRGESFLVLAPPEQKLNGEWTVLTPEQLDPYYSPPLSGQLRWRLEDRGGNIVTVLAAVGILAFQPALKDDSTLSEVVAIADGAGSVIPGLDSTTVTLSKLTPLANCYDRATVAINANVAPATHGETVSEIAGSGDASQPNQHFQLKQSPLTYVSSASDPSGGVSTLQVRINDLLWDQKPTLYNSGPKDRVYALRRDDAGKTTIDFGDGVQGARLPSAQNNVRLTYRKGLGTGGNLRTGQLTTLLTRPLGVKAATNPTPATGGQDPEALVRARQNAPLRVLTLDRAVSTQDYADFSRAFAGIAKAYAIWINDGRARGVYVTVAGADGTPIPDGSDTQKHLIEALRRFGDPLLPLSVQTYGAATFTLKATIKVAVDADRDKTLTAVEAALRATYAFDRRDFGQQVTIDEVYAAIQGIAGVIASDIQQLYRTDIDAIAPQPQPWLLAALPALQDDGTVNAAELLTIDPAQLQLGVMP